MITPVQLAKQTSRMASLPEIYWQLRHLMENPKATVADFAALIRLDPGLSAKLLQIANSALYGLSRRVDTVTYAVSMLGTSVIHDLVLMSAISRNFSGIPSEVENLGKFWRRSVFCGLAARYMAERFQMLASERLFTAGLLHDLGHLALCMILPDELRLTLAASAAEQRPLDEVQREHWGFDSGAVGQELAAAWRLPLILQESAGFHRHPALAKEFRLETALVHLAWRLAMQMEKGDDYEAFAPLDPVTPELLGNAEPDLQSAQAAAADQLRDTVTLFIH